MHSLSISDGAVSGQVRSWLRVEGFAVVALSVFLYKISGWSWWMFLALLLTPDLSMLPYPINPKVGGASTTSSTVILCRWFWRPSPSPSVALECCRTSIYGRPTLAWIGFWATV